MSVEIAVSFASDRLVSPAKWQSAIDAHGFPLQLDDFEWKGQSGFLPATLGGASTGFELDVLKASEIDQMMGVALPSGHDALVVFRFGGDMNECKTAVCAAAVLAEITSGSYHDLDAGVSYPPAEALRQARDTISLT